MKRKDAKAKLDLARDGRFGANRRASMLSVIDDIYIGIYLALDDAIKSIGDKEIISRDEFFDIIIKVKNELH